MTKRCRTTPRGGYGGEAKPGRMDRGTGDCNETEFPGPEAGQRSWGVPTRLVLNYVQARASARELGTPATPGPSAETRLTKALPNIPTHR